MNKQELANALGCGLFSDAAATVSVRLDQPSAGPIAMSGIELAYDGFDWEMGHFILQPSIPLVSWDYLERVHPGIREMIEQDSKAYNRRPRRVIVAGSRSFGNSTQDYALMKETMENLSVPPYIPSESIEVVSGCAKGADTLGAEIARELGYAVKEFPADWDSYGKAAGMMRNRQMAEYAAEDDRRWKGMLLAFWDGKSRGTANMIELAEKYGLEVRVTRFD